jgi:hypothetical protein
VSVPAREQRVLDEIEIMLQAGEVRLASMFALFTRLARDEGMPACTRGMPAGGQYRRAGGGLAGRACGRG